MQITFGTIIEIKTKTTILWLEQSIFNMMAQVEHPKYEASTWNVTSWCQQSHKSLYLYLCEYECFCVWVMSHDLTHSIISNQCSTPYHLIEIYVSYMKGSLVVKIITSLQLETTRMYILLVMHNWREKLFVEYLNH